MEQHDPLIKKEIHLEERVDPAHESKKNVPSKKLSFLIQLSIVLVIFTVTLFIYFLSVEVKFVNQMVSQPSKAVSEDILAMVTPSVVDQKFRYVQLKNGFKGILVSDQNSVKSSCAVLIPAGGNDDPADYGGLAHLLEHYLHMGTKRHPSETLYKRTLYSNGGGFNAFTSNMKTGYYFYVNNNALDTMLDIFSGFFEEPNFIAEVIEREANAVHSEYEKNLVKDGWRFYQLLRNLAYKSHPFNRFMIGNLNTLVHKRGKEDLASVAKKFYREHYVTEKMTFAIYGNYTLDELETLARKNFANVNTEEKSYRNQIKDSQKEFDSEIKGIHSGTSSSFRFAEFLSKPNVSPYSFEQFKDCSEHQENSEKEKEKISMKSSTSRGRPFMERMMGKKIYYESAGGSKSLSIVIPFSHNPDEIVKFSDFFRYLGSVIEYSGRNSLVSYLKKEKLIREIEADYDNVSEDSRLFIIKCELTDEGMAREEEIESILYSYLDAMINDLEPSFYDEFALVSFINFKFNSAPGPVSMAINSCYKTNTNPFNYMNGTVPLHPINAFFGPKGIEISPEKSFTIVGVSKLDKSSGNSGNYRLKSNGTESSKAEEQVPLSDAAKDENYPLLEDGEIIQYLYNPYKVKKVIKDSREIYSSSEMVDQTISKTNSEMKGFDSYLTDSRFADKEEKSGNASNATNSTSTKKNSTSTKKNSTSTKKNSTNTKNSTEPKAASNSTQSKKASNSSSSKPKVPESTPKSKVFTQEDFNFKYKVVFREDFEVKRLVNISILDSQEILLPRRNRFIPNDLSISFESKCSLLKSTDNSTKKANKTLLSESAAWNIPKEFTQIFNEFIARILNLITALDGIDPDNTCMTEVLKKDSERNSPSVYKKANGKVLYKFSARNFRIPKVIAFVEIGNPALRGNLKNTIVSILDLKAKDELLNEKFADAKVLNKISIGLKDNFITVSIEAFSEKFSDIMEEVIDVVSVSNFVKSEDFNKIKSNLIHSFESFKYRAAYAKASYFLDYLLVEESASVQDCLETVKNLNYSEFLSVTETLKKKNDYVKSMVYGNVVNENVKYFNKILSERYPILNTTTDFSRSFTHAHLLKPGTNIIFQVKNELEADVNHAIMNYYQIGKTSDKQKLIIAFLSDFMRSIAFDYLRTKKQLGYVAQVFPLVRGDIYGIYFLVQGSFKSPFIMNKEIEKALFITKDSISSITQSTLDNFVSSKEKSRKTNTFQSKAGNAWEKLSDPNYISSISPFKVQELKDFFHQVFEKEVRKISVQIFASKKAEEMGKVLDEKLEFSGKKGQFANSHDEFKKLIS